MGDRTQLVVKKPNAKKDNSVTKSRKTDYSQSKWSPADHVLYLQRTIGNKAVQRLINSGVLQAKLRIGQLGSKYEQEANCIADEVMQMPEPKVIAQSAGKPSIQRMCSEFQKEELRRQPIEDEVDEELQTSALVHRKDYEEENVRTKPTLQQEETGSFEISVDFENRLHSDRGRGVPLPYQLRDEFEPKFGADFNAVRIHTGTESAELNQLVQAKAFTHGSDIHFGAGQYDPSSTTGKELLAHELTHVVQQDAVKRDNSVRFRPALVQGNVSRAIQRAIRIPAGVLAALAVAGSSIISCIIGAAIGVGLDYAIQRGVAWLRNQPFHWNTCFAIISGIIGCVAAGVGSVISRAIFRSTGGHLEKDFATKAVVWLITWFYGRLPIWPIAFILKKLVKLGCANDSELPPSVQTE
ncbi:MAG: DUF4157 domain-containing protein [Deltaproteobacteria bacterium]|nr:DUF4157 domain-containing protein [Deltaproteobacteria bacterium]